MLLVGTYRDVELDRSHPLAEAIAIPVVYALWLLGQPDRRLRMLGWGLAVWAFAMAWSVVFTGEHYVLGAMAGAVWAVLVFACLRVLHVIGDSAEDRRTAVAPQHSTPAPAIQAEATGARSACGRRTT